MFDFRFSLYFPVRVSKSLSLQFTSYNSLTDWMYSLFSIFVFFFVFHQSGIWICYSFRFVLFFFFLLLSCIPMPSLICSNLQLSQYRKEKSIKKTARKNPSNELLHRNDISVGSLFSGFFFFMSDLTIWCHRCLESKQHTLMARNTYIQRPQHTMDAFNAYPQTQK